MLEIRCFFKCSVWKKNHKSCSSVKHISETKDLPKRATNQYLCFTLMHIMREEITQWTLNKN